VTSGNRPIAGRAQESLKEIEGRPRPVGWLTEKDSVLWRLKQNALFSEAPVITKWKRRLSPDLDKSKTESILTRRNAIFSGVRAAIFAMNHLYAAGRRRTFLLSGNAVPFLWHDMLVMQKSHSEDKRFWVGPCLEDMADFRKQWRLCHEASLAELAQKPDGPGLEPPTAIGGPSRAPSTKSVEILRLLSSSMLSPTPST
jgi:hypothetical protein